MKKFLVTTILVLAVCVGTAYSTERPGGMRGDMPPERPRMEPAFIDVLDWLDLSGPQKVKMVALFKGQLGDMEQMQAERGEPPFEVMKAVRDAIERGDVQETTALARKESARYEQLLIKLVQFVADFRAILTDAQRSKMDGVRDRMRARRELHQKEFAQARDGEPQRPGEGVRPPVPGKPHMGVPRGPLQDLQRDIEQWIQENS